MTFEEELTEGLKHYGVLGMKWGVRKQRKRESNDKYSARIKKHQGKAVKKIEKYAKKATARKADADFYRQEQSEALARYQTSGERGNAAAARAKANREKLRSETRWTKRGRAKSEKAAIRYEQEALDAEARLARGLDEVNRYKAQEYYQTEKGKKQIAKGQKFISKMEKTFANQSVSDVSGDIARGRELLQNVLKQLEENSK